MQGFGYTLFLTFLSCFMSLARAEHPFLLASQGDALAELHDDVTSKDDPPVRYDTIRGVPVQLELGKKWNKKRLNALLAKASTLTDPNERLVFLALQFQGVPFHFESEQSLPMTKHLRINFRSFDCTTFIYQMLALNRSQTFADLPHELATIRYHDWSVKGLHPDPQNGNIFDYVYNSLVDHGTQSGRLITYTDELPQTMLRKATKRFQVQRRNQKTDQTRQLITPKLNNNETVSVSYIPTKYVDEKDIRKHVKSGDVLLFVRRRAEDGIFGHLAIALKGRDVPFQFTDNQQSLDKLYYIQSSIHDDQYGKRLGVNIAGSFVEGSKTRKTINGRRRTIYRYNSSVPRLVSDFLTENKQAYKGIVLLRPQ